ncbi:putative Ig domain-containing protein [Cysteiniphilum litorale]|uniref:putative Ig domain-containing protein n=1 Tax=Cysteiniphilum litorale TaxID=2056700 RepID=UPI003F8839CB
MDLQGIAKEDETLSVVLSNVEDDDGFDHSKVKYQWYYSSWELIEGATKSTYQLTQKDVGKKLFVKINYTDYHGFDEQMESHETNTIENVNDPVSGAISIIGSAIEGETIYAVLYDVQDEDGFNPDAIHYQWFLDNEKIIGAESETLDLISEYAGGVVHVTASFIDNYGSYESLTTEGVLVEAKTPVAKLGSISIKGIAKEDQILTIEVAGGTPIYQGQYGFKWYADGEEILGADSMTYQLTQAEVGKWVHAKMSFITGVYELSNIVGRVENVNDSVVGYVIVDGQVSENQWVSANIDNIFDEDGFELAAVQYQWYINDVAMIGANNSSYLIPLNTVGQSLYVKVSFNDNYGQYEEVDSQQFTIDFNQNVPATGEALIIGEPHVGKTLSIDTSTIKDDDGLGSFKYQWYRQGSGEITGATAKSYNVTASDLDQQLYVVISFTDKKGNQERIVSNSVQISQVENIVATGDLFKETRRFYYEEDVTLYLNTSSITDANGLGQFSYQWFADGVVINGANKSSFTPGQREVNKYITAEVSFIDGDGYRELVSDVTPYRIENDNDEPVGNIYLIGAAVEYNTLYVNTNNLSDEDGLGELRYRWYANDQLLLDSRQANSFTLTQAHVGKKMHVEVHYNDLYGHYERNIFTPKTVAVTNVNDPVIGNITIAGEMFEDQIISVDTSALTDKDGIASFSYQWYANGVAISGAIESVYELKQFDVAKEISIRVGVVDSYGNTSYLFVSAPERVENINDQAGGEVLINGNMQDGTTIFADISNIVDEDGFDPNNVVFQWYADDVAIIGANKYYYQLTQAEVATKLKVSVTFIDRYGHLEQVFSDVSASVENYNDPVLGQIAIVGALIENQALTVDTSNISDKDGISSLSYRWFADGVELSDAYNASLVLDQSLVGKTIAVEVLVTDQFGHEEGLNTQLTGLVKNVNDSVKGQLSIIGDLMQYATLTVDTSQLMDEDGLGEFNYQWYANGKIIAGAIDKTYLLTQAEVGKLITVTVSYIDSYGQLESISFASITAVANSNDIPVGLPLIEGEVRQYETLSIDMTQVFDADGMGGLTYQWHANDQMIIDATDASYTLTQHDVTKAISVEVSYIDGQGTKEVLRSQKTEAVANVNETTAGYIALEGEFKDNHTVRVNTDELVDQDGIQSLSYQWQYSINGVDWYDIDQAVDQTLTLTDAQVSQYIRAKVIVTDSFNEVSNAFISEASTLVIDSNDAPSAMVLDNVLYRLAEHTDTISRIKLADITLTDDGLGSNILTLSGVDAEAFEIIDHALYLKAGTSLAFDTRSAYFVRVHVDDVDLDGNANVFVDYRLNIIDPRLFEIKPLGNAIVGEVNLDESGSTLAYSADGNIVAIGAAKNDVGVWGSSKGHVRVYHFDNNQWLQLGSDLDGINDNDYFGKSLDISADGQRLVVGMNTPDYKGIAKVYEYDGVNWVQLGADITSLNTAGGQHAQGADVKLSADGNRVIISDTGSITINQYEGSVRLFDYIDGDWQQVGQTIIGEAKSDRLGEKVDISADGRIIAVSTTLNDAGGTSAGHVRLYQYDGAMWSQLGADIDGVATNERLGANVSLADNGLRIAIVSGQTNEVTVYDYDNNQWHKAGDTLTHRVDVNNYYNNAVSLSADGMRLAVGVSRANDGDGEVFFYDWDQNINDWLLLTKTLKGSGEERFGVTVALNAAGDKVAIGAPDADIIKNGLQYDIGKVRVYSLSLNYLPEALSNRITLNEDSDYIFQTQDFGFNDRDHQSLASIKITAIGDLDQLRLNGQVVKLGDIILAQDINNGSLTFTAKDNQYGVDYDRFEFTVNDGVIDSLNSYTMHIDVTAVNDAPILSGTPLTSINQDAYYSFTPTVVDVDVNDRYMFSIVNKPSWASFDPNNGALMGMPTNSDSGVYHNIEIIVEDAWGATDSTGVFSIDVININDAPVGDLLILGQPQLGEVLSVSLENISDQNGIDHDSIVYQWYVNDRLIEDATEQTLAVQSSHMGKTITVKVKYFDQSGHQEEVVAHIDIADIINQEPTAIVLNNLIKTLPENKETSEAIKLADIGLQGDTTGTHLFTLKGADAQSFEVIDNALYLKSGVMLSFVDKPIYFVTVSVDDLEVAGDPDVTIDYQLMISDARELFIDQIGASVIGEANLDESGSMLAYSADGKTLAIGAAKNDANAQGSNKGHVRVYHSDGEQWLQLGDDLDGIYANDYFGERLDLSADGKRLIIAMNTPDNEGLAKVYEYNGVHWLQIGGDINALGLMSDQRIQELDVKLNVNGNRAVVSNTGSMSLDNYEGAMRVFDYIDGQWQQVGQTIVGQNAYDRLGERIDISANGHIIAASIRGGQYASIAAGSVSLYQYDGNEWLQLGESINGTTVHQDFGANLSLSDDGLSVAIVSGQSNEVVVYDYDGAQWQQKGSRISDSVVNTAYYNNAPDTTVSLSADGRRVAIGISRANNGDGQVVLYDWDDTINDWRLLTETINGINKERVGASISLSAHGDQIAVGAPYFNNLTSLKNGLHYHVGKVDIYTLSYSNTSLELNNQQQASASYAADLNHLTTANNHNDLLSTNNNSSGDLIVDDGYHASSILMLNEYSANYIAVNPKTTVRDDTSALYTGAVVDDHAMDSESYTSKVNDNDDSDYFSINDRNVSVEYMANDYTVQITSSINDALMLENGSSSVEIEDSSNALDPSIEQENQEKNEKQQPEAEAQSSSLNMENEPVNLLAKLKQKWLKADTDDEEEYSEYQHAYKVQLAKAKLLDDFGNKQQG